MFIFTLISSTVIDIKINIVPSDTKTFLMTGDAAVDAVSTQDWGFVRASKSMVQTGPSV